jgi:hypothetical protein
MCLEEIGLCSKYDTILGSTVDMIGGYDHLITVRISSSIINKISIQAPKIMRKESSASIWVRQPYHANRVFHILGKVVNQRKQPLETHVPYT